MSKSLRSDFAHMRQHLDNLWRIHRGMQDTAVKRTMGGELSLLDLAYRITHRNAFAHVTGRALRVADPPPPPVTKATRRGNKQPGPPR